VKVWIYKGDILVKKLAKEEREARKHELEELQGASAGAAQSGEAPAIETKGEV
jgi:ribosomal protein S3